MTFTYDLDTDVGKVRLILQDNEETYRIFYDEEIQSFLDAVDQSVRLATADALDTIASNEALLTKAIKLLDVSTNGPAVAAALRAHADKLRELATAEDAEVGGGFEIAELALGPFSIREQLLNARVSNG